MDGVSYTFLRPWSIGDNIHSPNTAANNSVEQQEHMVWE